VPQLCLVNLIELDPPRNGGASRIARDVTRLLLDHARCGELTTLVAVGRRFASRFAAWVGDEAASVLPCLDDPGPIVEALEVIAHLQETLKRRPPVPETLARSLKALVRSALARLRRA
jgi:hypothetical protein